jgi:hypothetical protein
VFTLKVKDVIISLLNQIPDSVNWELRIMTQTIGSFAKNLILTTNLTNTEILTEVNKQFPSGKTSMACIAWYKSDLRKKGQLAKRGTPEPSLEEKILALESQLEALKAKQVPVEVE